MDAGQPRRRDAASARRFSSMSRQALALAGELVQAVQQLAVDLVEKITWDGHLVVSGRAKSPGRRARRNEDSGVDGRVVEEMQIRVAEARSRIEDAGARTAAVGDDVRDDHRMLRAVPALESDGAHDEGRESGQREDAGNPPPGGTTSATSPMR